LPSEDERLAYCRYWRQKFIDSDEVDFPEEICHAVAKLTEKFTFAYLKELFVSSLLLLVGSGTDELEGPASEVAADGEASTPRSTLPSLSVPENVQDNLLFKMIEVQARALLADLESEPSTAVNPPNAARPPPPRFNMPSLIDEPDE
jgi:transitional endoplasmic reticulum ATPase